MALIAYSMAGEGRGHATRAKTIIDHLVKRQHQVVVFAPAFAHQFLKTVYKQEHRVIVNEIPGLMFHYFRKRLSFMKTTSYGARYLLSLPKLINKLSEQLRFYDPDLAITDFEPALPRAASHSGVPWISVDHQHFLVFSDFSSLPRKLQFKAWSMGQIVKRYYNRPVKSVVSSFYFPKLRSNCDDVIQTGVLLRDAVVLAQPECEQHVVAYLRRHAAPKMLNALRRCRCDVMLYGLGERPSDENLHFRRISESSFLEDLRTSRALISSAGNQLVGEALFLKKPVFVVPEEKNFEQEINARYLRETGGGDWCHMAELTENHFANFINTCGQYECSTPRAKLNGNNATLQVIESMLPIEANVQVQLQNNEVKV